jgi:hypothetical protein
MLASKMPMGNNRAMKTQKIRGLDELLLPHHVVLLETLILTLDGKDQHPRQETPATATIPSLRPAAQPPRYAAEQR